MAAAEAKQGKPKKVKHPHLRALRSKLGAISRNKDKDGSGSFHAGSPSSEQVTLAPSDSSSEGPCCRAFSSNNSATALS